MRDVVIVGAGPVGGYAARRLAEAGMDVLLLEEHSEIGRPFQCAGLVNPTSMVKVDLRETILQDVAGARIHGPTNTMVPVGVDEVIRTHVVCRKRFDEAVVLQGMNAGAELWLRTRPTDMALDSEGVTIDLNREGFHEQIRTRLVIGADGAHSWVRRTMKLGRPKELMIGFQAEVTGYQGRTGWLDMYLGSDYAPGFFAWVIPSGHGTHRIGLWSRPDDLDGRSLESSYDALLDHPIHAGRFKDIKEIARFCGPIPSGIVRRPYAERVMLIGDASGGAKPTTGGGIGPGFAQVDAMTTELSEAVRRNDLRASIMKRIARHHGPIRKEQDRARALRDFFLTTREDEELDRFVATFARPEVLELINAQGDIEHPVRLGMSLLKRVPEFRGLAIKAGWSLVMS